MRLQIAPYHSLCPRSLSPSRINQTPRKDTNPGRNGRDLCFEAAAEMAGRAGMMSDSPAPSRRFHALISDPISVPIRLS